MTREEEVALVEAVINCPVGYDLDLFGGMMCIRTTGGPMNMEETVEVEWEVMIGAKPNRGTQSFPKNPTDIRAAAQFFVDKRHELQIGIDYEEMDLASLKRESPR
jgi:hypothetical protein